MSGAFSTHGQLMSLFLSSVVYRSALYRRSLEGDAPADLKRVFPRVLSGDPARGAAVLDGGFLLAGRRMPFGRMPWSMLPAGAVLADAMHGFGFLADLEASGGEAARTRARELVAGWIATHRRWTLPAWAPRTLARRLVNWLAAGNFLLAGSTEADRAAFLKAACGQARHLLRVARRGDDADADGFPIATGCIAAALCLGIGDVTAAVARLQASISALIQADGGHCSRNPSRHLAALVDLLDIRTALSIADYAVPPFLDGAIERMAPVLRVYRLGDGGLALFHGSKDTGRSQLDVVLAACRSKEPAPDSLPLSGFERLTAGRTVLLCDSGAPPPTRDAHASPLAFELSLGRERLIVNCGAFHGDDRQWREALKATAAHSTLTVGGVDAVPPPRTWWGGRRSLHVAVERREVEGAVWLDASHDGYRARFGLTHHRRVYLDPLGEDIRGEDVLEGRAGRTFAVRFHLHPNVKAALASDTQSVLLKTNVGGWRFLAVGGTISVEESIYLGTSDIPQRTQQIVVAGTVRRGGAHVKWAIRREGGEP